MVLESGLLQLQNKRWHHTGPERTSRRSNHGWTQELVCSVCVISSFNLGKMLCQNLSCPRKTLIFCYENKPKTILNETWPTTALHGTATWNPCMDVFLWGNHGGFSCLNLTIHICVAWPQSLTVSASLVFKCLIKLICHLILSSVWNWRKSHLKYRTLGN